MEYRNQILQGHVLDVLRQLPDCLVDCVVTSPPYWGLRDYGTESQIWDGNPRCVHEWGEWQEYHEERESTKIGKTRTTDRFYGDESRRFNGNHQRHTAGAFCRLCEAWCGSLGLEPTLDLYIKHIVEIFQEVHRVLKKKGTLWLNMGDCYFGGGRAGSNPEYFGKHKMFGKTGWDPAVFGKPMQIPPGFKAKDMVGLPWRTAFALQADGWYLRRDIIWSKPNPMPESVLDRPTTSHEYLFLLSKRGRYFYDADAIKESVSGNAHPRGNGVNPKAKFPHGWDKENHGRAGYGRFRPRQNASFSAAISGPLFSTRNRRSVWTIATQPYSEAHFATFPEALVEPCIRAGCPVGGTVLDPFMGSGTVALVAKKLGRDFLGIELKPEYIKMAWRRLKAEIPLFLEN